jgi:hypothetical protein
MKIVRTLNEQPHPSIINFQSFIITPSFVSDFGLPGLYSAECPFTGHDCHVCFTRVNYDLVSNEYPGPTFRS